MLVYEIRLAEPPLLVCKLTLMEPLPVAAPIVFPVVVPIFAFPAVTVIPEKFPLIVAADEFEFTEKFAIVFP